MGPDAAPLLHPQTFPLRGGAGVIVLDERGVRHPKRPRGGAFVHTPYEEIAHVACSPRAMWLGARRSVYVFPRRSFEQPEGPERLIRALGARLAERPGGEAQLARMTQIERFSREPAPTRATFALALLCLVVFALHLLIGRGVEDVGFYTRLLVADGDWWRLFTANLLHGFPKVPVHLVLNLLGLIALGTLAERPLGTARTVVVMGAAGIGGMVASGWAGHPRVVGVSGIVLGLLGAITWLELRAAEQLPAWWRVPRRAIYWLVGINAALPLVLPVIAWGAHLGGFVAGAAAVAMSGATARRSPSPAWVRLAAPAVVVSTLAALVVAGTELRRPGGYTPVLFERLARLPGVPTNELNNEAWFVAIDPESTPQLLEAALAMAERAVQETQRAEPTLLDTLAEVQFQLGRSEAAVATIQEAIVRQPFEPYYREQLRRFLGERDAEDRPSPPGFPEEPAPPADPGISV